MVKLITLSIFVALFSTSCIDPDDQTRKVMQSWMGHYKKDLILKWGPPVRTASDGNKGEILVYSRQVYMPDFGINHYEYSMFYADPNGKLYYWMFKREKVPPTQIDLNIYRR